MKVDGEPADSVELESHPFEPFAPESAKVLIMGTFRRSANDGLWISITPTVPMTSGR